MKSKCCGAEADFIEVEDTDLNRAFRWFECTQCNKLCDVVEEEGDHD